MQCVSALWRWIVRECTAMMRRLEWIETHHGRFAAALVPAIAMVGPFGAAIGSGRWWFGLLAAAILWPTVWIMYREIDPAELDEPASQEQAEDLDGVDLPN